jgi:hypothetical protein
MHIQGSELNLFGDFFIVCQNIIGANFGENESIVIADAFKNLLYQTNIQYLYFSEHFLNSKTIKKELLDLLEINKKKLIIHKNSHNMNNYWTLRKKGQEEEEEDKEKEKEDDDDYDKEDDAHDDKEDDDDDEEDDEQDCIIKNRLSELVRLLKNAKADYAVEVINQAIKNLENEELKNKNSTMITPVHKKK